MNSTRLQFHAALVAAYADLFANDPAYAFSAAKCTPLSLADKMLAACVGGTADYSGKGCQRAAKACGIGGAKKDIRAFLGCVETPKYAAAPHKPRKVQVLGLSNIEAMMTGVSRIHRAHDLVVLHYTDGTTEAGNISADKWAEIHEKPFAIVSAVQAQRVPANA